MTKRTINRLSVDLKKTDQKKKPTVKPQRCFKEKAGARAIISQIEYLQQQIEAIQRSLLGKTVQVRRKTFIEEGIVDGVLPNDLIRFKKTKRMYEDGRIETFDEDVGNEQFDYTGSLWKTVPPTMENGADKNRPGSNPHDHKSDMMKSGIAGENKGNQQMSDESDRRMTVLMNVFEAYVTSMLKKNVTGMDFASMSDPLTNEEVMNLLATVNFVLFQKLLTTNDSSITAVNDNKNTLAILTRNRQTGQKVTITLNVPGAKDRVPIINAMYDLASKNDDQALLEETLKHGKEYVIEKYKVREHMKKQNDLDEELVKKGIMKKVETR